MSTSEAKDQDDYAHMWTYYLTFESCSREKDEKIEDFLHNWKSKMIAAQTAGCQYSDILLAFKLLDKANLKQNDAKDIISSIRLSSTGLFSSMLDKLEAYHLEQSPGENEQEHLIVVDKFDGVIDDKKEILDYSSSSKQVQHTLTYRSFSSSGVHDSAQLDCPKCPNRLLDTIVIDETDPARRSKLACCVCGFGLLLAAIQEEREVDGKKVLLPLRNPGIGGLDVKDEPAEAHPSFLDISVMDLADDQHNSFPGLLDMEPQEEEDYPVEEKPRIKDIKPPQKKSEKMHKCEECQKQFTRPVLLKAHIAKGHGPKPPKEKVKKEVEEGEKVKRRRKQNVGPYQCEHCGKKLARRSHLRAHVEKMHINGQDNPKEDRPTTCKICGKSFARYYNYKIHLSIHTGEKSLKCDECDETFSYASLLSYHKMKHSGERPYKCDQCTKSFLSSSNLVLHMRGEHLNERPFQCEHCNQTFVSKPHLQRHVWTHTGERPYKCNFCDKAYRDHKSRKRHLKSHSQSEIVGVPVLVSSAPPLKVKEDLNDFKE